MKTLVIIGENYIDKAIYHCEDYPGNFAKIAIMDGVNTLEYSVSEVCILEILEDFEIEYSDNWLEDISNYQPTKKIGILLTN
jgi:hypothetical protein